MASDNFDSAPASDETASAMPGILQVLWRHKLLVLLGPLVSLTLGALYFAQLAPVYQSSAQLLVIKKRPDAIPVSGADGRFPITEDFLATHQLLLSSPAIIKQAVKIGNLQSLASVGSGDPTATIKAGLHITREAIGNAGTSVLHLSYKSPLAHECPLVLDAVIKSYEQFLEKEYHNVSGETVKFIKDARDELEKRWTAKQKEHGEFLVKNPLLRRGKDGNNVVQERVFAIETRRSNLRIQQTEVESRLGILEKAIKENRSREELLVLIQVQPATAGLSTASKTPVVLALEDSLLKLQLEEQQLLADYAPGHPQVRDLRRRIDFLKTRLQQEQTGTAANVAEKTPSTDPVQTALLTLRRELEAVRSSEKALADLLKTEQAEVTRLFQLQTQEEGIRTDFERSKNLCDTIAKRLEEVNVVRDLGGFSAKILSPAGDGGQVAPRAMPIFLLFGAVGLLAGFGLAYLAELSDQSFRTPEEIRRRLGLPVVGYVPHFITHPEDEPQTTETGPQLASSLWVVHHSRSREAEAYRAVRTAVYFSTAGGNHKIIQVTSPEMGDGKTTLASNLAISIAQSGKKVILIDADLRRPNMHRLFGIQSELGLSSVLSGDVEPSEVIQASAVPGLHLLPAGPPPSNPAELLSLPRFEELLAYLRERYDIVLVDTPPLLAVTDPCVVSAQVDGILLVVKLSNRARPQAERAREILNSLKANIIGVVVNGGDLHASRRYGYHRYGYGYGYGYGYYTHKEEVANGESANSSGFPVTVAGVAAQPRQPATSSRSHKKRHRSWWSWLRS